MIFIIPDALGFVQAPGLNHSHHLTFIVFSFTSYEKAQTLQFSEHHIFTSKIQQLSICVFIQIVYL